MTKVSDTSFSDIGFDAEFRQLVNVYKTMGYGRMAQIVSEERRRYDPDSGGLLFVCPKCDELYIYDTKETYKQYWKRVGLK